MNIGGVTNYVASASGEIEKTNIKRSTEQRGDSPGEKLEMQHHRRFDEFVRENQSESDSQGKEILDALKDKTEKKGDDVKDDGTPKRIGTMGMLEKICRREGPNGTCNHNDDTPGAYTEQPIYG